MRYIRRMSALPKVTTPMTVQDFLAWEEPWQGRWQLVDGEPVGMAPASPAHGAIQAELAKLLSIALERRDLPCRVIVAPGVTPRVRSNINFRIPDLGVFCGDFEPEQSALPEPTMVVEILSPSNEVQTWSNVWTYTTIPGLREILVLRSDRIHAELLRRATDGSWPKEPAAIVGGDLGLDSLEARFPLVAAYRTSGLLSP
jgi:Uma2 family endonuclease